MARYRTYNPLVLEALTGGNWALSRASSAIHMVRTSLVDSMPVECCTLVTETVVDVDDHAVSLHHVNRRTRPITV